MLTLQDLLAPVLHVDDTDPSIHEPERQSDSWAENWNIAAPLSPFAMCMFWEAFNDRT